MILMRMPLGATGYCNRDGCISANLRLLKAVFSYIRLS